MDHHLLITGEDLKKALRFLKNFLKEKKAGEAFLTFSGNLLQIEFPETSTSIPAQGKWKGTVRFPGRFLWGFRFEGIKNNSMNVSVENNRLIFGTHSTECVVDEARVSHEVVPLKQKRR